MLNSSNVLISGPCEAVVTSMAAYLLGLDMVSSFNK